MTKDKSILILNIYYMLSYAFEELKKNNYENIRKEKFEHVHDLLAEILCKGVSAQLKRGLYREYAERTEDLPVLRGRLDMIGTSVNKARCRSRLSCEYDELSENNIFNRILKTTMCLLLHVPYVSNCRKARLRQLLPFFSGVDETDVRSVRWSDLVYKRNNRLYRMLMNVCYFIIDGMVMTTEAGNYKMMGFSDEHMNRLFERFVLEYYRFHHKELSPNPDRIEWHIDKDEPCMIDFLPVMKSDIALHKGERTLIIDTKYYGNAMQYNFDKPAVHSGNMYQIYAYVKNRDSDNTGKVSGLLLYAKTDEEITPDLSACFGRNRIMVKTLDLNKTFDEITMQLESIADELA